MNVATLLNFSLIGASNIPCSLSTQFSSVQQLNHVRLFATPWTAACQTSLYITNSWSLPNVHWVYLCPLSRWCHPTISSSVVSFSSCPIFPSIRVFSNESALCGQIIGVSALTSVLPVNTRDWSPLGWTGWISLHSTGLSRVFSNTTVQKHQFFGAQDSL